jgi:hypothetical protein
MGLAQMPSWSIQPGRYCHNPSQNIGILVLNHTPVADRYGVRFR